MKYSLYHSSKHAVGIINISCSHSLPIGRLQGKPHYI